MRRLINRLVSAILLSCYRAHDIDHHLVLVKFLRDFVVGVDSVVIETYYAPPGIPTTTDFSTQWEGTISFLGILEVSFAHRRVDRSASCQHAAGWLY